MHPEVVRKLLQYTQAFYERHADSFCASRSAPWPGWHLLRPRVSGRILDLGCGNGRFLEFVRDEWGFDGEYMGLDASSGLLKSAAKKFGEVDRVTWRESDLLAEEWSQELFDLVVAWGLLHHVPGAVTRERFVRRMASSVAPGGELGISFWQFRHHERFWNKELAPSRYGFANDALEVGDALLGWDDDDSVPRYCHHFDDEEVAAIEQAVFASHPDFVASERASRDSYGPRKNQKLSDRFNAYLVLQRQR